MKVALEALDALGLALAGHNHQWTARERFLYERAVISLSAADTQNAAPEVLASLSRIEGVIRQIERTGAAAKTQTLRSAS